MGAKRHVIPQPHRRHQDVNRNFSLFVITLYLAPATPATSLSGDFAFSPHLFTCLPKRFRGWRSFGLRIAGSDVAPGPRRGSGSALDAASRRANARTSSALYAADMHSTHFPRAFSLRTCRPQRQRIEASTLAARPPGRAKRIPRRRHIRHTAFRDQACPDLELVGLIARFVPRITLSDITRLYGFRAAFWRSCRPLPYQYPDAVRPIPSRRQSRQGFVRLTWLFSHNLNGPLSL